MAQQKKWLDSRTEAFSQVPILDDNGISTTEFLNASQSLCIVIDAVKLGDFFSGMVKNDINGNVEKLRKGQEAYKPQSQTIQGLCRQERLDKKNNATQGLLWLYRTLQFLLEALSDTSVPLPTAFQQAYQKTLRKHHNIAVAVLIKAVWSLVTDRQTFYSQLGDNQEQVKKALETDTQALQKIVNILGGFFESTDPNGRRYDDEKFK